MNVTYFEIEATLGIQLPLTLYKTLSTILLTTIQKDTRID